jgi:hypothetical protein
MEDSKLISMVSYFRVSYDVGYNFGAYENYNDEVFYEIITNFQRNNNLKFLEEEISEIKRKVDSEFQIYQPDGIALIDDYEHEKDWYTKEKDNIRQFYWNRYRNYLFNSGWTTDVLKTLEYNTLDKLMNLLGNPKSTEHFDRKGLVMGDVQSGKTSNYIGLINKAVDAGYKVIILLTGTIEPLRRQTQIRVEEGFIGYDANSQTWVGVGENSPEGTDIPHSVTSRENDFTGISGETTGLHISSHNKIPLIFVTKKNPKTLKKIKDVLSNINIFPPNKQINSSLLVIDDEADNASVNTSDPEYDPTRINREIRGILKLFTKKNYVGFTATPFANVFIDPNSESEMLNGDLFPKDFIYVLNSPNNYLGAEKLFIEKKYNIVQTITDHSDYFPLKHNKDWYGETLFPSINEAINAFLIINVIRDLREKNRKNSHRSMLINISRFIKVQNRIEEIVSIKIQNILNAIKQSSKLNYDQYIGNTYIKDLFETYKKHYDLFYNWEIILSMLYDSTKNIEIFKVPSNDKKKQLDYEKHKENGLRCIVIGGLSLSRGLTLEGLTISYLYRGTSTFDVLMQMGRWFGYRSKPEEYGDLCKVWMLNQTKKYFEDITESITTLKNDLRELAISEKTPKEFGIRVRNESDSLGITDRNKMRFTKKYVHTYDLYGKVLETPFVSSNNKIILKNMKVIEEFALKLDYEKEKKHLISKNIDFELITNLIDNLSIHEANRINYFEKDKIINFIKQSDYENFDVIFMSGASSSEIEIKNYYVNPIERSFDVLDFETIRLSGKRRRLGAKEDTKNGLTKDQIAALGNLEKASNSTFLIEGRNPLLLIYPIKLKKVKETDDIIYSPNEAKIIDSLVDEININELVLYGLGVGFPYDSKKINLQTEIYVIADRTNWWNLMNKKDSEEDEQ